MSGLGNYGIPADLAKEAAKLSASRFQLLVPETVTRKKGIARWNEAVQVKGAFRETVTSGAGDEHVVFTINTVVLAGTDTPNEGRNYTFSARINYDSLGRSADDGQRMMSMGTVNKLIQVAQAAASDLFDEEVGLTEQVVDTLFPLKESDDTSMLEGAKLVLVMTDNEDPKKQFNDRNAQEVRSILPYTEE